MATNRTITLKGDPHVEDITSSGVISPGHLVELQSDGTVTVFNALQGTNAARMFALERDEVGGDINTAYASGDDIKVGSFSTGDRVHARIAASVTVTRGAFVEAAADGTVVTLAAAVATDATERAGVIGIARETVTAPGGAEAFLDIELL